MVQVNGSLTKWGNSQGIRLPKNVMEAAGFNENENVEIIADESGIHLKKTEKHFNSLQELFDASGYHGYYKCEEVDTGASVGEEVW